MANDQATLFSRQGYMVDHKRLGITEEQFDKFISDLQDKYDYLFDELGADEILFDGELLPWNAMGKDLIERDFMSIAKGLDSEISLLDENGFPQLWNEILDRANNIIVDETTKPHEIREKKQVEKVKDEIQPLDQMKNDVDKYTYQVNLFASDAELEFRAFSILKIIKTNGDEVNTVSSTTSNIELSKLLQLSMFCILHLNGENLLESECEIFSLHKFTGSEYNLESNLKVTDFWNMITKDKEMEGIVIKPEYTYVPGVAPYLKCRNKEYLRITYGPDYQSLDVKKNKLIRNKSIKRKIETSIKEWELGRKLLDISQKDISIDNKKWIGLITQLMTEQEKEGELDPRL